MSLFDFEYSEEPKQKLPLMVTGIGEEPKKMEPEEYTPLLKKYWDFATALAFLKIKGTIYTPKHQFTLCE